MNVGLLMPASTKKHTPAREIHAATSVKPHLLFHLKQAVENKEATIDQQKGVAFQYDNQTTQTVDVSVKAKRL